MVPLEFYQNLQTHTCVRHENYSIMYKKINYLKPSSGKSLQVVVIEMMTNLMIKLTCD